MLVTIYVYNQAFPDRQDAAENHGSAGGGLARFLLWLPGFAACRSALITQILGEHRGAKEANRFV
ncbi:hypothetical protein J31TS4_36850 [Paenibacillus sp. J31TS4]|nr:hypothetical protein J31TS4_36850 [Paenibacillus sp. J31TS4]